MKSEKKERERERKDGKRKKRGSTMRKIMKDDFQKAKKPKRSDDEDKAMSKNHNSP